MLQGVLRAGAYLDLAAFDIAQLASGSDSAYDIPHMTVDLKLAKCNLPPHTIMRGPGTMQGVLVAEQVTPVHSL